MTDDPEENAGFIPPLPKDDRLWRHPSEMTASQTFPPSPNPRRSSHTGLVAFLFVGFMATAIGVAALSFRGPSSTPLGGTQFSLGPDATAITEADLNALTSTLVQITIDGPSGLTVATGLIVRSDGYVITSADPIKGARSITVTVADGRAFNAAVVGNDTADDLAVIAIAATGLPTPRLGTLASVRDGDTAYVVSRAAGDTRVWISAARIQSSGLRLTTSDGSSLHDMTQSTLDTPPPSLSAVLCNQAGEVIGLLTSRTPTATSRSELPSAPSTLALQRVHVAYAHPVSWMSHVAENIIATGVVHNASLGVMAADAVEGGASIESVNPEGPAAIAGLDVGDRVTSLAGKPVRSSSELIVILRRFSANDTVTIECMRGETSMSVAVTLGDRI